MTEQSDQPSITPDDWRSWGWHDQGACVNLPTDMFYYEDNERGPDRIRREQNALAVCKSCTVKDLCLADALARNDRHAIQGGTTPAQRGHTKQTKPALPIEVILKDREGRNVNAKTKEKTIKAHRTLNG